ncbi:MAG: pimeloyl-ACP methyl ester esterase BioH [Candidatus Polarisedimenticolaceae bacterium]|nr:pimeloyl-ACP methyl ester esterase BioH [Candidatus Polarisedimenticolaceae bacterium]
MKLYSETFGNDGPDLLLLHGWGMNAAVWSNIRDALARHYRVTLIELPGHGASEYEASERLLEAWAEAVLAVAPEKAIWIGWSLGGAISQWVALNRPERVTKLVVVTGTPRFVATENWHGMDAAVYESFSAALADDHNQALGQFLSLQVQGGSDARKTLRQLRQEINARPEPNLAALKNGLELLQTIDLREALPNLRCPSLWIFGQRDTLVSVKIADKIEAMLPTAEIQILPHCAHAPFISHRDETLVRLQHFIGTDNEQ